MKICTLFLEVFLDFSPLDMREPRSGEHKNLWGQGRKYVNTAEIIIKVTMTLSIINSNNDFDSASQAIKTPSILFSQCKFHYVKETQMMLIAFWRW